MLVIPLLVSYIMQNFTLLNLIKFFVIVLFSCVNSGVYWGYFGFA